MTDEEKDKIEELLNGFERLKAKIKLLLLEIADDSISVKAVNYKKALSGKTNDFYSEVENVIQERDDIEKSYPDIMRKIIKREQIQAAIDSLTEKKQLFIQYKYFEEMSDLEISIRFRGRDRQIYGSSYSEEKSVWYSIPTIQRIKNECLEDLYKAGILGDCLK